MSENVDLKESILLDRINNNDKILRTLVKKLIELKHITSEEKKSIVKSEIAEIIFLYRFQLTRAKVQLRSLSKDEQYYIGLAKVNGKFISS